MKIRAARELADSKYKTRLIYPEFFDMSAVSVGSIARTILEEFEISPIPQDSTARVRRIKQLLTSLERDDYRVALVFDECHRLNDKVLIALKNFWELTDGKYSRLLGVVLFGQPRFVESTLRDYRFREIAERVQVIEMPSLAQTSAEYLSHKIACVGGNINQLFDSESIRRICSVAKTPLSLGNLTNAALMEAYKLEETQVVSQLLNLPDTPALRQIRRAA
jgi:type II secretory pathway predicted ATPase ExeA